MASAHVAEKERMLGALYATTSKYDADDDLQKKEASQAYRLSDTRGWPAF